MEYYIGVKMHNVILLFPGRDNNADEWKKIVDYDHPDRGRKIDFLKRIKELKIPVSFVSIDWSKKLDINKFCQELGESFSSKTKFILIGHSFASVFCYYFAQKFKKRVIKILLLDPTVIGPEGKDKVQKVLAEQKDEVRINYVKQTPLKTIRWPAPVVVYRNVHIKPDGSTKYKKEKESSTYKVRCYINVGHFVQIHNHILDDIICDLSN